MDRLERPNLQDPKAVEALPCRSHPYWNILEYCRHIGVEKRQGYPAFWCARIRKRDGRYKQAQLARYCQATDYSQAIELARAWFTLPEIASIASESYPVGYNEELKYTKTIPEFTIGDAMVDYVQWKRIVAPDTGFFATLSRINYHIIPRLGNLPAAQLTHRRFVEFCRDVLESPPKRGKRPLGPRLELSDMDSEALRKRKKTVNELVSILKVAIRFAWENGELETTRPWRILKHLPHQDVPRQIFLSRDECRRLILQCREDLADLVRGALYTGCRVGELARLTVSDVPVDLSGIYIRTSKNGCSRFVYLPPEGMSFLRGLCAGRNPDTHVFRFRTRRRWSKAYQGMFKKAVINAGLPPEFVFHGLRHTYASQLVQAGTPMAVVARQLGHVTIDTVCKTYGHLAGATVAAEISNRFSPLELTDTDEQSGRAKSPLSKEDNEEPELQITTSWPAKNYSRFHDPLVEEIKNR